MKTFAFITGLTFGAAVGAVGAMMLPDHCKIRKKARRAAHEIENSICHAMDCLCR